MAPARLRADTGSGEPIIHSTLLYILLAATISGVGSIFGAALLSLTVASRVVERMVSFSVGVRGRITSYSIHYTKLWIQLIDTAGPTYAC